jgi:hypothetical protein
MVFPADCSAVGGGWLWGKLVEEGDDVLLLVLLREPHGRPLALMRRQRRVRSRFCLPFTYEPSCPCVGRVPCVNEMLVCAPKSMRTMLAWPFSAAIMSADSPFFDCVFTSAPCSAARRRPQPHQS